MELVKLFDKVFHETMQELGLQNWWELFDSNDFEIVEKRLIEYQDTKEYKEWVAEMVAEL